MLKADIKDKISVIIPVYNAEKYICECINSLLEQDYPNYEIILIDDGSSDTCGAICDRYASKYPFITVIHQENRGAAAARNTGMSVANGRYILFVDADDWIDKDYLTVLEKHMVPKGMSLCDFIFVPEDSSTQKFAKKASERIGSQTLWVNSLSPIEARISMLRMDGISTCGTCKLFDKTVIDKYRLCCPESCTIGEDLIFLAQYLLHSTNKIVWIHEPKYKYRQHSNSTMHRMFEIKSDDVEILCREYRAWEQISNYITNSQEELTALEIRLTYVKCETINILIFNNFKDNKIYTNLLKEIRKNLRLFLLYDGGQTLRQKIKVAICSFNPKLEFLLWSLKRKLRQFRGGKK